MWKLQFSETNRNKYRSYSPSAMMSAYMKVREMNTSIRSTAKEFGVPVQTLRDRLTGKVDHETVKSGPSPLFSEEQEVKLANHLKFMASVGYGYTRSEVVDLATDYAVDLGYRSKDNPLSLQWYSNFMSRWPELKVMKPRGLQIQRAKATSAECVSNYFRELGKIITKYHLSDKPERIFNVDEKGLSTTHKPPKVVAATGTKPPSVVSGTRNTVTVLGCGNAMGHQVPPYFIFPGERMRAELLDGKSVGADGTVTQSGWSNSKVFKTYLQSHLLRYLPERNPDQPVLLLYDGHKSHISLDLIDWARKEHIILFVLPAHTSHVLQPMDIGCFGPFEKVYNAISHKYMREHCGATITRNNICLIACKAYVVALSPQNLQAAFSKSGIFPFNPQIVDQTQFLPGSVLEQEKEDQQSSPENSQKSNNDILEVKEHQIKKKKPKTVKRKYLSYVVSGKPITEDDVVEKINEHEKNRKTKTSKTKTSSGVKKRMLKNKESDSPKPGPSHCSGDSADISSQGEEEKCCVCNHFCPRELLDVVSEVYVKWAQCDNCGHWVHLSYCCDTRVVRRGDIFLCPHCTEE